MLLAVLRSGTCYILPLLGAFLADSYWGRFATIIVFSIIYMLVRTAGHFMTKSWAPGHLSWVDAVVLHALSSRGFTSKGEWRVA